MAKATNKVSNTEGTKTTDKTRISFDAKKARENLLNQKNGVCPFCGHKL